MTDFLISTIVLLSFAVISLAAWLNHTRMRLDNAIESRDRWRGLAKDNIAAWGRHTGDRLEMLSALLKGVPLEKAAVEEARAVIREVNEGFKPRFEAMSIIDETDCT